MVPLAIVAAIAALVVSAGCRPPAPTVAPLDDKTFWALSHSLSEPPKAFDQPDNLVSNESLYAEFVRLIRRRGGAYVGVGPEQNFSYIARIDPTIAFVVDIRLDNRNLHLMYKALFDAAADRASFVALLFSRPLAAVDRDATVAELFAAVESATPSPETLWRTKRLLRERLIEAHGFPLTDADLQSMDAALEAFYADGPAIRYGRSLPPSHTRPSYRTLMTQADLWGNAQSYLASQSAYADVKKLHAANLIVPVVGDFAGPHTLRGIGDYLRAHGQTLSAFYASNVEVYLTRTKRRTFCASLETLPHDEETHFIGNRRLVTVPSKLQTCARIQPSLLFPEGFGS
jgi:hypothetical protein